MIPTKTDQLKDTLFHKAMEAHAKETNYSIDISFGDIVTLRIYARMGEALALVYFDAFEKLGRYVEELNYIDCVLNHFNRHGEPHMPYVKELAQKLLADAQKKEYDLTAQEIAEHLDIPMEVLTDGKDQQTA